MNDSTILLLGAVLLFLHGQFIFGLAMLAWACWAVTYEAEDDRRR